MLTRDFPNPVETVFDDFETKPMDARSFSDLLAHSLIPASAAHGDGVFLLFHIYYHDLKLAKIWEERN